MRHLYLSLIHVYHAPVQLARGGKHAQQMDHPRAAEDRPHRLSVADPPLHRRGRRVHLRADRAGVRRRRRDRRNAVRHPGRRAVLASTASTAASMPSSTITSLHEPALDRLAVIVRGADTARPDLAPQAAGLLAISLGLSANFADDHAMLEHGMVIYDALYTWCRSLQHEAHNWTPGRPLPPARRPDRCERARATLAAVASRGRRRRSDGRARCQLRRGGPRLGAGSRC